MMDTLKALSEVWQVIASLTGILFAVVMLFLASRFVTRTHCANCRKAIADRQVEIEAEQASQKNTMTEILARLPTAQALQDQNDKLTTISVNVATLAGEMIGIRTNIAILTRAHTGES